MSETHTDVTREQMMASWEAERSANLAIPRDEFIARFKAHMLATAGEKFEDGESIAEYADEAGEEGRAELKRLLDLACDTAVSDEGIGMAFRRSSDLLTLVAAAAPSSSDEAVRAALEAAAQEAQNAADEWAKFAWGHDTDGSKDRCYARATGLEIAARIRALSPADRKVER